MNNIATQKYFNAQKLIEELTELKDQVIDRDTKYIYLYFDKVWKGEFNYTCNILKICSIGYGQKLQK